MLGDGQARRVGPYLASTCRCCPGCAGGTARRQGTSVAAGPQLPQPHNTRPRTCPQKSGTCCASSPPLNQNHPRRPPQLPRAPTRARSMRAQRNTLSAPQEMHGSSGDSVSECALAAGYRRECAALGARARAGWPASPRPPACSRIGCLARLLTTPPAAAAARPTPKRCRGCHRRPWSRP